MDAFGFGAPSQQSQVQNYSQPIQQQQSQNNASFDPFGASPAIPPGAMGGGMLQPQVVSPNQYGGASSAAKVTSSDPFASLVAFPNKQATVPPPNTAIGGKGQSLMSMTSGSNFAPSSAPMNMGASNFAQPQQQGMGMGGFSGHQMGFGGQMGYNAPLAGQTMYRPPMYGGQPPQMQNPGMNGGGFNNGYQPQQSFF
jgi:hypothetical protein